VAEHFPEVATEPASLEGSQGQHQASCECGWKAPLRSDWDQACDDADNHIAAAQPLQGEEGTK
jgi:hypothetical protein